MSFFLFKDIKLIYNYIINIMMSEKTENKINNLLYYKIENLVNSNNLFYIKNDIFENLRDNYKLNFYEYKNIYNYLNSQLLSNREKFTQIETMEELQSNLQNKFNKFIDKNYIKKIFTEIKRNEYS